MFVEALDWLYSPQPARHVGLHSGSAASPIAKHSIVQKLRAMALYYMALLPPGVYQ